MIMRILQLCPQFPFPPTDGGKIGMLSITKSLVDNGAYVHVLCLSRTIPSDNDIQGFKEYCALMFFKGALLKDEKGLLRAPGQNTQSGRLIPFTSLEQIIEQADVLKAYIHEAIDNEKAGLKVVHKQVSDYPVPEELSDMFLKKPA